MRYAILLYAFLFLIMQTALPQAAAKFGFPSWELTYSEGLSAGGPSVNYQLNGINYSYRTRNNFHALITLSRNFNKNVGVGIIFMKMNQFMEAKKDIYSNPCFIRSVFFSPAIKIFHKNFICLESGPAFNFISYQHTVEHIGPGQWFIESKKYFNPGFLVKSSIKAPAHSTLYLLAEIQYIYQGIIRPEVYRAVGFHQYMSINNGNLTLSSWYAGAGIGVRLFKKI